MASLSSIATKSLWLSPEKISTDKQYSVFLNDIGAPFDQPVELEDNDEVSEETDSEDADIDHQNTSENRNRLKEFTDYYRNDHHKIVSKSRCVWHTPSYVRLRSILI